MLKVLLADDEYLEREALKIILHEGIEDAVIVGEAHTGKSAVDLFSAHHPNLVFMDIKMPIMDGLEAAEIIKKQNKDTIIIILTAYESFKYAQKALQFGADDYILKPARPDDIIQAVNKQIALRAISHPKTLSIDLLIQHIQQEDYRSAKDELKQVIQRLIRDFGVNMDKLVENAQTTSRKIQEVAQQMGIQTKASFSKDLQEINSYNYEAKLFQQLAGIFHQIIEHQGMDENSGIQGILNYIEKNFTRGITLEEVADYAHLSPYYLSKLFKKELNINFVNYVMERRIEKAKELLTYTDMPILNISIELSYNEPNYFSKVFKKITGMTPTEYREVMLQEKGELLGSTIKKHRYGN